MLLGQCLTRYSAAIQQLHCIHVLLRFHLHTAVALIVEPLGGSQHFFIRQCLKLGLTLFLLHIEDGSLFCKRFDLGLCLFHKGCHIRFAGDTMLVEKLKLCPELLKAHDLLTHFSCDSWRILPLFDFAEDVEIVVVQGQKASVLRVLLIGLVRLTMNNSKLFACEYCVHVSVNGRTNSIFGILRVLPFRVHEMTLSAEPKTQAAAVLDLVAFSLHEPKEVSDGIGILNG